MVLYLDASAAVKLVVRESESPALRALWESSDQWVSSALLKVELLRSSKRIDQPVLSNAHQILSAVSLVAIGSSVIERAAELAPAMLRSLDAIHLATALSLRPDLEAVVSYDDRLNAAAESHALSVLAPA